MKKRKQSKIISQKPVISLIFIIIWFMVLLLFISIPNIYEKAKYFEHAQKRDAVVTNINQSDKKYLVSIQYEIDGMVKKDGIISKHKYKIGDKFSIYTNSKYTDRIKTNSYRIKFIDWSILGYELFSIVICTILLIYRLKNNYKISDYSLNMESDNFF